MCLAVYKPAIVTPDWNALQNAMIANPDGAGFAVAVKGKLIVKKGFFKFEDFKKAFEKYQEYPALIHFRWATHGVKDENNCHPFELAPFGGRSRNVAVIHNGVFDVTCDNKAMSDTWHVCRDVLAPFWRADSHFFLKDHVSTLGEAYCTDNRSKLLFLDGDGNYNIWNEGAGHWHDDGHWYSNHSYEDYRYSNPAFTGAAGSKNYSLTQWSDEDWDEQISKYDFPSEKWLDEDWMRDELIACAYTEEEIDEFEEEGCMHEVIRSIYGTLVKEQIEKLNAI